MIHLTNRNIFRSMNTIHNRFEQNSKLVINISNPCLFIYIEVHMYTYI